MSRPLRVLLVLLLAVVLVPVGLFLGSGVVRLVQLDAARDRAAAERDAGLPAARASAEDALDGALAAVRATGTGAERARFAELSCRLESVDAGWVPQSYDDVCVVRAVAILVLPEGTEVGDSCEGLGIPDPPDRAEPRTFAVAQRGPAAALTAERPWEHDCTSDLREPGTGRTLVLEGDRPAPPAPGEAWVVVRSEARVSRTGLGCRPFSVLFCGGPRAGDLGRPPEGR
ncbi:hypothetical protein KC207_15280 [Phycicoccus sp. BSK3Z-2]|uniref:Uncharacterized protein n=1 Tax=Phycicoccus avicenniae TaxID=2828860 RepID=A0A941D9W6_9MICO|nr:hypothetical protein [Phycicoccus avicenniae]MBR7744658.1 hypothetical protein [Phycicoccus avicenniae]